MVRRTWVGVLAVLIMLGSAATARAAEEYNIDAAHSGVNFKISHLGLAWVYGRFNEFSGNFSIDRENPASSSFSLSIKPESVDSNNPKRDDHLRSPDFFNVK